MREILKEICHDRLDTEIEPKIADLAANLQSLARSGYDNDIERIVDKSLSEVLWQFSL
jgi:hypothetical protein